MFKQTVKNIIGNNFSSFDYPIVVNSYGRSGSTLLTRSIMKGGVKPQIEPLNKTASGSINKSAWDLEVANLEPGYVYKTHDYPPTQMPNKNIKMLYTFADPVDVVLSLIRLREEKSESWMKHHYDHLGATYTNFKGIINKDQLHLEDHITSWLNEKRISIAFIRYETMWEHQDEISDFLGFSIKLPPYRDRKATDFNYGDVLEIIQKTYKPLRKKIDSLDNFFMINYHD